ncbi:uncharacterized protein plekhg2 isoform X2 [Cheilinus undulatus]|uniref:uncharacterized protein plekhg2 isoform X2 n=1 Tax=Cheilinus undulatus TaxID=241271 RepID=UPI001BD5875F|nr:uncharacterized protein plekhg2 isoform X2 [Cheilinus undulatus]
MPEGSRRGSQRSPSNTAAKRPSSVSSLSGIVGRMMSSGDRGASSSSCTSVNTVCSDGERPASLSLSSSASSVSLQEASHSSSSSSSSSSLPYGAVPTYNALSSSSSSSTPKRNGSDISLDLTPLVTPHGGAPGGGGVCLAKVSGGGHAPNGHVANQVAAVMATPRQLSRLERVVLEIVETEQAYVRDLKSIVEDYLGCIIDCGALPLKPEQVSTLFCNIEDIYEFNSDLLEDLERSPHAAAIAECFVERSEAFDIYTLYCMNYPNSVAVLRECMKNKTLVSFFQERQTTLNHSLPLETYLLKPVQRILKYHLLLQELLKHFDKSDPGYEVVEDAIITMTAVAWYINDMKRKQEHAVRLQEIESLLVNWSGPDLSGFGELVLEGSFKVQRVKKERAFFLFDKMLLIAKKRLEQFVYSTHIFCCNLLLVETLKDPLCFKVSDQTIPKQQHVVQTKNQEEKRLWVHYLKRLIVENHPASLPQKARQVLGDNFCTSPQFDQDSLKKSSASSRFDDIHGYHRGRRQSGQEPPELLMYTPEKSRKSLPLLLEGNLPYRRTRRQSAPAKDIEAAFHPNALKQAGSEGELCQTESLGSAGSSSTLASSVIEVEAERSEPGLMNQQHPSQEEEEEEEEELTPLSPPPTLSITEEILEFINQSRAREGFATIQTNATEQVLDQPKDNQPSSDGTNFTCPLPPVACPSSPEQRPTNKSEQEIVYMENNISLQSQTVGSGDENALDVEKSSDDVFEASDETSSGGKGSEVSAETQGEVVEKAIEEDKTRDDSEDQNIIVVPTPDPNSSTSVDEGPLLLLKEGAKTEATSPFQNPDILHCPNQRRHPPTRGSHLTKRDKKIIEKIRSYYEAAAEAEEDGEEDEDEPGHGASSKRRNSFSQIPCGLVKESVSLFDVTEHQGESDGGQLVAMGTSEVTNAKTNQDAEPCSPVGSMSSTTALPLNTETDGQTETSASIPDSDAEVPVESPTLSFMQDKETPDEVCLNQQYSMERPDGEETEQQVKNERPCKEPLEEGLMERQIEGQTCVQAAEDQYKLLMQGEKFKSRDETTKTNAADQALMNGHDPDQARQAEPNTSLKQNLQPLTKTQPTWTRTKQEEVAKKSGNSEGLPSQVKVGRWSRHSRIVTANRALFEGMASDIAGIRLFEASPVVDPVLMENSERILSKVQTLAKMYSTKANTMKVPLHQKRAIAVRNQLSVSSRVSGLSSQAQTKSQTQVPAHMQTQTEYRQQAKCQMEMRESDKAIKHRTQADLEAKGQSKSKTITQPSHTKRQLWSQTQAHQSMTKTHSKCQTTSMSQEDQGSLEKKMIKGAQSLITDFQETVMGPCEPLLFGHVFVKEQFTPTCHQQTNGVILSRPRDFISALAKESDSTVTCRSDDICQCPTIPGGNPSTLPRQKSSIQAQSQSCNAGSSSAEKFSTASRHHFKTEPEDPGFGLCCSANNSPLMSAMDLDCGATKFKENCTNSSKGKDKALTQNGDVYLDTEDMDKEEGSELNAGWHVDSAVKDSATVSIVTQPAHSEPSLSAQDMPQWGTIIDGKEQDICEPDIPPKEVPDYIMSIGPGDKGVQSFHAGSERICLRPIDGEESPVQLVLMVASSDSGLVRGQAQMETLHLLGGCTTTLAPSGAPEKDENPSKQTNINEAKCYFKDSSLQTRIIQGSTVTFTEQPPYHNMSTGELDVPPPLHKTPEPSPVFNHTVTAKGKEASSLWLIQNAESNPTQSQPPCVQSIDALPTFTGQNPPAQPGTLGDLAAPNTRNVKSPSQHEQSFRELDQQSSGYQSCQPNSSVSSGSHPPSRPSLEAISQKEKPYSAVTTQGHDKELTKATSTFIPSHRTHCPSPVRTLPSSSASYINANTCPSSFRVIPASSIPQSHEEASGNISSRAPSCFSPLTSGIGTSIQDPPSSSPAPSSAFTNSSASSSSWRSSSIRTGPPSSPSPIRSSACSSPINSSSAFNRSLAASCISQSISQSLARKNATLQPTQQTNRVSPSPSSHLRQRSPSPKLPPSQQSSKDACHLPRSPPSSPWSPYPSASPVQSPQHPPSSSIDSAHHQPPHFSAPSPRTSFLHGKNDPTKNANNNNNNPSLAGITAAIRDASNANSHKMSCAISNGGWSVSSQKMPQANGSSNDTGLHQSHEPHVLGSHNRVARPFSASEPSSRVQSPSPSPTTSLFTRLCSPPPQHNYSSPMAHKPPHPRSTRVGDAGSHNPLGLTLELPRAPSSSSEYGQSSTGLSPRILSPPPIGVSVNVWTNNVAAPQPRNPRYAPSSHVPSFSPSVGSPTQETYPCSSSLVSLRNSRASSASASQSASQTLRRSLSSTLADRPPSPARSNSSGVRRSWADSSRRSLGFSGIGRGSLDQQDSCPTSPRSGWSSYSSSPSCLSPQAGLQSPLSPSRLTSGKGAHGGQHFTSVPWPDVRELSHKYNGPEVLDSTSASTINTFSPVSPLPHTLLSSPAPSDNQAAWGDPELEEGLCRSQLICAYVARPSREQNLSSTCTVLPSSGMTSPPPVTYPHHIYQSQGKTQPQVQKEFQNDTTVPPVPSPIAPSPSPLPFAHSHTSKQGNQKASYATTVNLQIAGSGRITSFSTAQVSLTQTLQGGVGAGGPGQGQMTRRVSINGLSHLPSPVHQNCDGP